MITSQTNFYSGRITQLPSRARPSGRDSRFGCPSKLPHLAKTARRGANHDLSADPGPAQLPALVRFRTRLQRREDSYRALHPYRVFAGLDLGRTLRGLVHSANPGNARYNPLRVAQALLFL